MFCHNHTRCSPRLTFSLQLLSLKFQSWLMVSVCKNVFCSISESLVFLYCSPSTPVNKITFVVSLLLSSWLFITVLFVLFFSSLSQEDTLVTIPRLNLSCVLNFPIPPQVRAFLPFSWTQRFLSLLLTLSFPLGSNHDLVRHYVQPMSLSFHNMNDQIPIPSLCIASVVLILRFWYMCVCI